MGIMPCHSNCDCQSHSARFQSDLSTPSLTCQRSLHSVPSLTSQTHQRLSNVSIIHYHCLTTLKGHNSYVSSITLAGKFLYVGSSDREIRSWDCNPLTSQLDQEIINNNKVAVGKGAVKSLVVLADKLFSAHQDHKIRVWKINNQEHDHQQKYTRLATLPTLGDRAFKLLMPKNHVQIRRHKTSTWVHHVDTVSALALTTDGTLLYSVSWDRTIKIWRTSDFKCLESITNAHDDAINAVALSDGHVYTGSADKKIKVWRKNNGEKKHSLVSTLEKHNSGINALALSTDGFVLYSGACDRSILVWEKDESGNMELAGALRGHTKSILCISVVSDLVLSGSADKTIRIWRGIDRNYSCLAVLEGHKGPVKCLTAATDQYYNHSDTTYLVYSGSLDCDIKVWKIFVPLH
ncbi:protein JINGUBANG-like [Pistacia vera]|uniref:protein JINGUBANG-like n=1 Tax=Pistacia vera TaxID=55513 RepID=UPI0012631C92|nr:protein JINGUBANG-like [Pistacia vera]